ncbi:MAG: tRNA preQ1(34) S-adenosylmethionine ribosyltransferase-isomerase QueA [Deltaproteobacteria bacterium]|nr:MAG: tRNA preQ1(34) S-adenosylmethionine ribosyltransferase-isomerase QueA [Deltaproteobacteria bacterium]
MTSFEDSALWNYDLPESQIAARPTPRRPDARMLVVPGTGSFEDRTVRDLPDLLRAGDLLVVNDARVTPARLHGRRSTGGAVELLVVGLGEEGRWEEDGGPFVALHRSNRTLRDGEQVFLDGNGPSLTLVERADGGRALFSCDEPSLLDVLERWGAMPLPPYIVRRRERLDDAADVDDAERYQTVFAQRPGAVAAPTAGLHFDRNLLDAVRDRGVRTAPVTLLVGTGTFRPVGDGGLAAHPMHREWYDVPQDTAALIRSTRAAGGRVVAVGTTVVRTLEAAALGSSDDVPRAGADSTCLLIRPGHRWRVVDALFTNFHLPRSTLLALVAAFGGTARVGAAYEHAIRCGYRFYSYGDSMFLPGPPCPPAS